MKKHILKIEKNKDYSFWGILYDEPIHKLIWLIGQKINIQFQLNNNEFETEFFYYENTDKKYFLFQNSQMEKIIIPELKNIKILLKIVPKKEKNIISQLRDIKNIKSVIKIDVIKLKRNSLNFIEEMEI